MYYKVLREYVKIFRKKYIIMFGENFRKDM